MAPRISLIIGIAVTALAFGVPTAFGEGMLAGSPEPDGVAFFYANERATLTFAPVVHDDGDATEAKIVLQSPPLIVLRDHGDATQAQMAWQSASIRARESAHRIERGSASVPPVVRDHGDATQAKLVSQSSGSASLGEADVTSDWGINWSQLGIGFGLGLVLAGGLFLAMRMTKDRRIAQ